MLKYIIILILLLLLLCSVCIGSYCYITKKPYSWIYWKLINLPNNTFSSQKPYLWTYWELVNGATKPPDYINLCIKTMETNGGLFNLVILNEKTVYDYLPNMRKDIDQLPIALKSDYIRIALLYHYGGIWLDADTIMMTNLKEVVYLLNKGEDFIGFGCTGEICTNGYGVPSNGAMGAKKHSKLMKYCLDKLNEKLDNYFNDDSEDSEDIQDSEDTEDTEDTTDTTDTEDTKELGYFDLGKLIIWDGIRHLEQTENYTYYHFPSYVDGTRDKQGRWIATELTKPVNIELLDESKLMLVFLVNSTICGDNPEYNSFCKLNGQQILNGNYFVTHLFKRALNI